jgi:hypothetical protein
MQRSLLSKANRKEKYAGEDGWHSHVGNENDVDIVPSFRFPHIDDVKSQPFPK